MNKEMLKRVKREKRVKALIALIASFLASALLFAYLSKNNFAYLELMDTSSLGVSLIASFAFGVFIMTLYLVSSYKEYEKRLDPASKVNQLTQIYAGVLVVACSVAIIVLHWLTNLSLETLLLIFSLLVLTALFLTLPRYNEYLEKKLKV